MPAVLESGVAVGESVTVKSGITFKYLLILSQMFWIINVHDYSVVCVQVETFAWLLADYVSSLIKCVCVNFCWVGRVKEQADLTTDLDNVASLIINVS